MGYMKISNLYKDDTVLLFKTVFALEKVHGTSAHLSWNDGNIRLFSGGAKHSHFESYFDGELAPTLETIKEKLVEIFGVDTPVVIYGEAYGGKMQGMKETYGDVLRFIGFDVKVNGTWVNVTSAHDICDKVGLSFVDYAIVPATVEDLNAERDKPSTLAMINGCGDDRKREGIVIRPLIELTRSDGARIIAKHKRDDFAERKTKQKDIDPANLKVYAEAEAAAEEFVTDMRLCHVMDKVFAGGEKPDITRTGDVIKAMVTDVLTEAEGEVVDSKDLRKAISSRAAKMFKRKVTTI